MHRPRCRKPLSWEVHRAPQRQTGSFVASTSRKSCKQMPLFVSKHQLTKFIRCLFLEFIAEAKQANRMRRSWVCLPAHVPRKWLGCHPATTCCLPSPAGRIEKVSSTTSQFQTQPSRMQGCLHKANPAATKPAVSMQPPIFHNHLIFHNYLIFLKSYFLKILNYCSTQPPSKSTEETSMVQCLRGKLHCSGLQVRPTRDVRITRGKQNLWLAISTWLNLSVNLEISAIIAG